MRMSTRATGGQDRRDQLSERLLLPGVSGRRDDSQGSGRQVSTEQALAWGYLECKSCSIHRPALSYVSVFLNLCTPVPGHQAARVQALHFTRHQPISLRPNARSNASPSSRAVLSSLFPCSTFSGSG